MVHLGTQQIFTWNVKQCFVETKWHCEWYFTVSKLIWQNEILFHVKICLSKWLMLNSMQSISMTIMPPHRYTKENIASCFTYFLLSFWQAFTLDCIFGKKQRTKQSYGIHNPTINHSRDVWNQCSHIAWAGARRPTVSSREVQHKFLTEFELVALRLPGENTFLTWPARSFSRYAS